jgi:hypothetical protein
LKSAKDYIEAKKFDNLSVDARNLFHPGDSLKANLSRFIRWYADQYFEVPKTMEPILSSLKEFGILKAMNIDENDVVLQNTIADAMDFIETSGGWSLEKRLNQLKHYNVGEHAFTLRHCIPKERMVSEKLCYPELEPVLGLISQSCFTDFNGVCTRKWVETWWEENWVHVGGSIANKTKFAMLVKLLIEYNLIVILQDSTGSNHERIYGLGTRHPWYRPYRAYVDKCR